MRLMYKCRGDMIDRITPLIQYILQCAAKICCRPEYDTAECRICAQVEQTAESGQIFTAVPVFCTDQYQAFKAAQRVDKISSVSSFKCRNGLFIINHSV